MTVSPRACPWVCLEEEAGLQNLCRVGNFEQENRRQRVALSNANRTGTFGRVAGAVVGEGLRLFLFSEE